MMLRRALLLCAGPALWFLCGAQLEAMPVFAQRYALRCSACHTAMPELNDFGNAFRNAGYRLPPSVPRHGTTIAALRYNNEYEVDPAPGAPRFTPTASILADQDIGAITAYLHYTLGAGGAPANTYLGFLATYNAHTRELYRLGLFELPLTQSPGQRLDSIDEYGYFGTTVGQNDLALNAPRLGFETERQVGAVRLSATLAFGEFKGAAYGGKPVDDGTETVAKRPETGLYARVPIGRTGLTFNAQAVDGDRSIALPGRQPFDDPYDRIGFGLDWLTLGKRLDVTAQQWTGRDDDPDDSAVPLESSGGYARLKYFVTPHAYAALRYDAAANPFPARELVLYTGFMVFNHARIILERRQSLIGGTPSFGVSITTAGPWPLGL